MTNILPQLVYMLAEDLYRMGNAASPKLHNLRPDDIDRYERNGVEMVRANGKGISLITEAGLKRRVRLLSGFAWKLPLNLADHYLLCPASDITMGEYTGLLENLALKLERTHKL